MRSRLAAPLLTVFALAALLGGCKREPTFEERYDAANHAIVERARRIDAQIAGTAAPADPDEDAAADK